MTKHHHELSKPVACNGQLLVRLASAQATDSEQQQLASHLSECSQCTQELESLIERDTDHQQWRAALTNDGLDAEWQAVHSRWIQLPGIDEDFSTRSHQADQTQASISSVVKLLHPTDHLNSLGRYAGFEITGVVGAGGMGVVLKGLDVSLQRTVALKVLAPHLATSTLARRYFVREGQAAASILHPNVVPIHQVSEVESLPVIVMPYLGSETLQSRIDELGRFDVESIVRISRQIAAALAAAHHQGVIHRDIKPANILLEKNSERIVVTDFGLARVSDSGEGGLTEFAAGTPSYMSPEQARGETVATSSDLFSLGSVMYAMCTGQAPFRANNSLSILRMVNDDRPPSITERNPNAPNWLIVLIEWLHQKQPDQRPRDAKIVVDLLDRCLQHLQASDQVQLPSELVSHLPRPGSRRLTMVATFVIGVIALCLWPLVAKSLNRSLDQSLATTFVLPPEMMERAFFDGGESMSVRDMLWRYKEAKPLSQHESQTAAHLRTKYEAQVLQMTSDLERTVLRKAWANELLPLVVAELPVNKAKFFNELNLISSQVRDFDEQATNGVATPPLDWEMQVVQAFIDAHQKYVDDARREIESVIRKAKVNSADLRYRDAKVEFQGKLQTLQSVIVQLEFYQQIIDAMAIQTMGQE